ncbi:mycocerosic acid synthase-like polyketide synthase [Amphiura filiformis]|uniref:mycocerosic acid synthase-like polyketide synthase n=1 Tax=Amphiura filiformis TaxID=82378 RepID=UPI003B20DD67
METQTPTKSIAIVGIGCRFAGGVDTVEKFWQVLEEGRDCSSPHPESRFDASYFLSPGEKLPGKMYNLRGCYLTQDPYTFDRNFFKMSPDEAQHLDPTIRILLEVTWEALEDAGIAASAVRGSHTGVYVGGMNLSEYRSLVTSTIHNIGQYTNSGNTSCMMANRLSYEFDFRGPSIALDTACSSSLSAIFLACEALKSNQCPMAVAGGANIMLLPEAMVGLCQAGMVSPDGRSKSFDKTADGYGRGEGFGIVVLKTLEKALKDKDRIYAVIRGGALSSDGRTTGITSPSADAQHGLLEAACLNANVAPRDVTYAEAHGTGTAVGDKTEASVLGEFFGQCRSQKKPPLHVGSIKSNLGHTEGAAGVAGIIKTSLCLKNQVIPKVAHFNTPNSDLDFNKLNLRVPQDATPWPTEEPRVAICSSFGFGGSNACMILEANTFSQKKSTAICSQIPVPLLISAATEQSLLQRIRDWLAFLQCPETRSSERSFRDALYTAAQRSHHHPYRIGFVVTTVDEAIQLLETKLNEDGSKLRYVEGLARSVGLNDRIVFVFSGMGTQWWGMARELMNKEPVFAAMIKMIAKLLKSCGSKWSLIDMLTSETDTEKIHETEIAQPCICAVQIALVELWRSRHVVPDVIVGHSVGEVAAAYCAGLLSLQHAIGLIYHRGRQLRKTSGSGTMMAVLHPTQIVLELMQSNGYDQKLDVASINSPSQVVVSGDSKSINELMSEFKSTNIRCVQLKVRNAFHSRQQECLEKKFKTKVSKLLRSKHRADIEVQKTVPMISTVTGRYMTREEANSPQYWWKNIRQPVLFKTAVENLVKDGFQVFVEIGSHPALTPAITDTISNLRTSSSVKPVTCGSIIRPRDISKPAEDRINLLLSHLRLHVSGIKVNFKSYFEGNGTSVISIPKYPWQREPCIAILPDAIERYNNPAKHHPLLGEPQAHYSNPLSPSSMNSWKSRLTKSSVPWLKDHVIGGSIIFPAAAYIEMSLAVSRKQNEVSSIALRNIHFQKFMYVPESEGMLETTAEELLQSKTHVTIQNFDPDLNKWTQHMEADVVQQDSPVRSNFLDVESITKRCNISLATHTLSSLQEASGVIYGPSFQTTTQAFVNDECSEILTYCEASDMIYREFDKYVFHPAFLDGCLQSYAFLAGFKHQREAEIKGTLVNHVKQVPSQLRSFTLYRNVPKKIIVHLASFQEDGYNDEDASFCNIGVADADTNEIIVDVQYLQYQKFEADIELGPRVWSTHWVDVPAATHTKEKRRCLIIPDNAGICDTVVEHLQASGVSTIVAKDILNRKCNIRQYYDDEHSQSFTDILVLQTLDMADTLSRIHSNSTMTPEEFHSIQEKFPLFCISLISEVTDLNPDMWPRVMFVTAGAHAVFPGENVNPFVLQIQSLLMTFMHEEPQLQATSVDLPLGMDKAEASVTIHKAFFDLPEDENMLACRVNNHLTLASDMVLLAPRLHIDSLANYRVKSCKKSWVIQQNGKKAKVSLQATTNTTTPSISHGLGVVHTEAFCTIPYLAVEPVCENGNSSAQSGLLTIYAGVKQINNCHKNASISPQAKILGLTNHKITISSTMKFKPDGDHDFVDIPDDIKCSQAINIIKRYLPAQIFFHMVYPLTVSTRILFLADNETSESVLSFAELACFLGSHLTVVSVGNQNDGSKLENFQQSSNCNIISMKDVHDIGEMSFDLLIVPMIGSSLQKQVPDISAKLLRLNTVLYLFDGDIRRSTITYGNPCTKFMMFSTSLPRSLFGQTPQTLRAAALQIFTVFKTEGPKLTQMSNESRLSEVPLVNGALPAFSTIAINEDQTELPVELYGDLWHAEEDESYLVTGGKSGFGLSVVKWLVSRGATNVFVVSRQAPSEEVLGYFSGQGKTKIKHIRADVSRATDIETVLTTIQTSSSPPLAGIFHLATQYRDGYLYQTTQGRWNEVMEGKAYGALLLHQITQKLKIPLKYFVVSSSVVSMIGNAGQGNYCAANIFLNNLCLLRHHMKLPATAICIGFINSVGYAASNNLVKFGEERGMMSLSPEEVLLGFNIALSTEVPLMGFGGPVITRRFVKRNKPLMTHHFSKEQGRFSLLKDLLADTKDAMNQSSGSLDQVVMEMSEEEAKKLITGTLCKLLATQLGIPENVDTEVSLLSLGLDSLMATNLSEAVVDQFKITINPVTLINENMTIRLLQAEIFKHLATTMKTGEMVDEKVDSDGSKNQAKQVAKKPWVVGSSSMSKSSSSTPHLKMVCFPPTGGGASFFAAWSTPVKQFKIQLLQVQYPGSEGRESEPPPHSLKEIVDNVTEALIDQLDDRNFIFFGHSIGGLVAFEIAHSLLKYNLRPMHIFVSGFYAPTIPYPEKSFADSKSFAGLRRTLEASSDLDLFQYAIKHHEVSLPFFEDTVLSNRVLLLRLLPAIEASSNIIRAYKCETRDPLPCGMTVFGGKHDPYVSPRLLGDWKYQIAPGYRFKIIMLEGKHMFILSHVQTVLQEIGLALRKWKE